MTGKEQKVLNRNAPVLVMAGEETAGIVGTKVTDMLERLGIASERMDMSVPGRIVSQKGNIAGAIEAVRRSDKATLVKEPGVTPSPEQMLDAVIALESAGKLKFTDAGTNQQVQALREQHQPANAEANMVAFAYAVAGSTKNIENYRGQALEKSSGVIDATGSPNAVWRKELQATLLRGTSPKLEANLKGSLPEWSTATPLSVVVREATEKNTRYITVDAGKYTLQFKPESGEPVKVGAMEVDGNQTPIRLYHDSEQQFKQWFADTLNTIGNTEKLIHGMKQTVISIDYAYIEWMNEVLQERGQDGQIADFAAADTGASPRKLHPSILVDNVNGQLAANPPTEPTTIVAPNASYADYVKILEGIKDAGGFKRPVNSEIARASATKDHYARVEYRAEEAGTFQLLDASGAVVAEQAMQKDDLVLATNFDRARVNTLMRQVLGHAAKAGKPNLLVGFDAGHPYYKVAHEELETLRNQPEYANVNIVEKPPVEATVEYFTSGVRDTLLALGNIHGDFATDIELAGKGTSYSKALLADGRLAVETGSLGTAPDLLGGQGKGFGWKEDGILLYNPMAMVEAYAYALEGVSQNLPDGQEKQTVAVMADALEDAIYATTRKGYILPISKGTLQQDAGESETPVSCETFLKHIELETLRGLQAKGAYPELANNAMITQVEADFSRMAAIDAAIFAMTPEQKRQWQESNLEIQEKQGVSVIPDYNLHWLKGKKTDDISAESLLQWQREQLNARAA